MEKEMVYAQRWLDKATSAIDAAEVLNQLALIDAADQKLKIAEYCLRRSVVSRTRFEQNKINMLSKKQDTRLNIIGLIICIAVSIFIAYAAVHKN